MTKFAKFFMLLFMVAFVQVLMAQTPAPTNLTLTPEYSGMSAKVKLAWTAPTGVTGVKYNIYRKDINGGTTGVFVKKYSGIAATQFVDAAVMRGKSYAYYVVAYRNSANGAPSDTQQITLDPVVYAVIKGTVTADNGGALKGAKVQVISFLNATGPIDGFTAYTDSLGNYSLKLYAGVYALFFGRDGYVAEYYNNKATLALADTLTLAGNDTVTVDAGLAAIAPPSAPANLTATVTGTNLSAQVKLAWEHTNQNPAVRYMVYRKEGGLNDSGAFKKKYSGISGATYTDMQVQRGRTYSYYVVAYLGALLSVPSNSVEAVVGPATYAWVYGTVTSDSTGAPVYRAKVSVLPVFSITAGGPNAGTCMNTVTDSLGKYAVKVVPGTYAVYFSGAEMVSEYFNNKASLALADKLILAANDSVEASAGLAGYVAPPTYYVSGKVTDGSGNAKTAMVTMFRLRSNTFHYYSVGTRTDSLGNYKLKVKVGDTVVVYAQPMDRNYLSEYYSDKRTFAEADRIGVTGNVVDINFALEAKPVFPNGISGLVADSAGVGVLSHVAAYKMKSNGKIEKCYSTVSDSLGAYAFANMIPGKYLLRAVPTNNFLPTYFKYDGSQCNNYRLADSVMVDSASLVTAINFSLHPRTGSGFGHITGVVRNVSRQNVSGAFIFAVDANNEVASFAISDINGNYEISDLSAGMYTLVSEAFAYKEIRNADVAVDYLNNASQSISFNLEAEPDGTTSVSNTAVVDGYALQQNYPNPFNPTTNISFSLAEKSHVVLSVYDMVGRQVAVLVNGEQTPGNHTVSFNASGFASGVYFYKLQTSQFTATKKLVLMK